MDSSIGLSTMLAIGPDGFREHAGRLPRDGRALPDDAARAEPAGADGPARRLVRGLLRRPDDRRDAVRPVPRALPGLPPAADDGVEREVDDARRPPRRLRDQPGLLGRARDERPALLLPADPPGDAADPVRPDRVHADAEPARPAPRPAHGERLRAGRGARVREDGRRAARRGRRRGARPAPHVRRQPAHEHAAPRAAHAGGARDARRALRAQRLHAGDGVERELVRPVGGRAREGARPADRRRARGAGRRRPWRTTARRTR